MRTRRTDLADSGYGRLSLSYGAEAANGIPGSTGHESATIETFSEDGLLSPFTPSGVRGGTDISNSDLSFRPYSQVQITSELSSSAQSIRIATSHADTIIESMSDNTNTIVIPAAHVDPISSVAPSTYIPPAAQPVQPPVIPPVIPPVVPPPVIPPEPPVVPPVDPIVVPPPPPPPPPVVDELTVTSNPQAQAVADSASVHQLSSVSISTSVSGEHVSARMLAEQGETVTGIGITDTHTTALDSHGRLCEVLTATENSAADLQAVLRNETTTFDQLAPGTSATKHIEITVSEQDGNSITVSGDAVTESHAALPPPPPPPPPPPAHGVVSISDGTTGTPMLPSSESFHIFKNIILGDTNLTSPCSAQILIADNRGGVSDPGCVLTGTGLVDTGTYTSLSTGGNDARIYTASADNITDLQTIINNILGSPQTSNQNTLDNADWEITVTDLFSGSSHAKSGVLSHWTDTADNNGTSDITVYAPFTIEHSLPADIVVNRGSVSANTVLTVHVSYSDINGMMMWSQDAAVSSVNNNDDVTDTLTGTENQINAAFANSPWISDPNSGTFSSLHVTVAGSPDATLTWTPISGIAPSPKTEVDAFGHDGSAALVPENLQVGQAFATLSDTDGAGNPVTWEMISSPGGFLTLDGNRVTSIIPLTGMGGYSSGYVVAAHGQNGLVEYHTGSFEIVACDNLTLNAPADKFADVAHLNAVPLVPFSDFEVSCDHPSDILDRVTITGMNQIDGSAAPVDVLSGAHIHQIAQTDGSQNSLYAVDAGTAAQITSWIKAIHDTLAVDPESFDGQSAQTTFAIDVAGQPVNDQWSYNTITVGQDHAPDVPTLSNTNVNEGLDPGTFICDFQATDPDQGDAVTRSFGGPDAGLVSLVNGKFYTASTYDSSVIQDIHLTLHSVDGSGLQTDNAVDIHVNSTNQLSMSGASYNYYYVLPSAQHLEFRYYDDIPPTTSDNLFKNFAVYDTHSDRLLSTEIGLYFVDTNFSDSSAASAHNLIDTGTVVNGAEIFRLPDETAAQINADLATFQSSRTRYDIGCGGGYVTVTDIATGSHVTQNDGSEYSTISITNSGPNSLESVQAFDGSGHSLNPLHLNTGITIAETDPGGPYGAYASFVYVQYGCGTLSNLGSFYDQGETSVNGLNVERYRSNEQNLNLLQADIRGLEFDPIQMGGTAPTTVREIIEVSSATADNIYDSTAAQLVHLAGPPPAPPVDMGTATISLDNLNSNSVPGWVSNFDVGRINVSGIQGAYTLVAEGKDFTIDQNWGDLMTNGVFDPSISATENATIDVVQNNVVVDRKTFQINITGDSTPVNHISNFDPSNGSFLTLHTGEIGRLVQLDGSDLNVQFQKSSDNGAHWTPDTNLHDAVSSNGALNGDHQGQALSPQALAAALADWDAHGAIHHVA